MSIEILDLTGDDMATIVSALYSCYKHVPESRKDIYSVVKKILDEKQLSKFNEMLQ